MPKKILSIVCPECGDHFRTKLNKKGQVLKHCPRCKWRPDSKPEMRSRGRA